MSFSHKKSNNPFRTIRIRNRRITHKLNNQSSLLIRSPDHNSGEFYLIIHSDQTTKLSKA